MHDLEYYLAYPLRWLATWAGVTYNGEWRNACAAHIFAGMALAMIAMKISVYAIIPVAIYPLFREALDSKWFKNWNRKNWADVFTFLFGEVVGLIIAITGG